FTFPYHLFVPEFERTFWELTKRAYYSSTIVAFGSILLQGETKDGNHPITLRRFKNKVIEQTREYQREEISPEISEVFEQRKDGIKPLARKLELFEKQIEAIRNQHIAHLDIRKATAPDKVVPTALPLTVFREALELLDAIFRVLGFEVYYQLKVWDYTNPERKLDIDYILEDVVKRSYWFSDDPLIDFEHERSLLSDADKAILDEWVNRL
ncbi:MAG: hypothetical protein AAGK74_10490, partial [Chloroflexota bacterium]